MVFNVFSLLAISFTVSLRRKLPAKTLLYCKLNRYSHSFSRILGLHRFYFMLRIFYIVSNPLK